jgi:FAD/FMN-containing dehydrogenase
MRTPTIEECALAAVQDLRAVIQGKVVLPSDATSEVRSSIFNGAVTHQSALFALCETAEDVQAAVRVARSHKLPLSVRGGGHDWTGRALRDGGLVIDLTRMRQVDVNAEEKTATVAGGATALDVSAAGPRGLVAVTGNVGPVGMGGFLLGGGYSHLSTRFGLAVDNLLGAEVVLADGRLVWADASQNPDLFWGLRGGGGNFGAVTSMQIRLHPLSKVMAGLILFPWSEAESILREHIQILSSAPDELSIQAGGLPGPDGNLSLFLVPVWSGNQALGEEIIARLQRLGSPILTHIAPVDYADVVCLFDDHIVNGRHYTIQTRWLPDLTPRVISTLVKAGTQRTSPLSFLVLHHLHGAAMRVAPEAAAFGMRRKHFMLEIVPAWEPCSKAEGDVHRQWPSDLSRSLAPFALPGGYANYLTPNDHEQVSSAYGGNARRLRRVKRQFDPDNVFSSAAQLDLLRSYAAGRNLKIAEEFIDVETAKQAGRASFGRMVAFAHKHQVA